MAKGKHAIGCNCARCREHSRRLGIDPPVQLLRSTFSIQANIAEGSAKRSDREFTRYIRIALGSSTEAANHLILLHDLSAIDDSVFRSLDAKQDVVGKMLSGLEKKLSSVEPDLPHQ